MISIWLIIGILFSNSLFFLFGCLAKVGYFPFSLLLCYQYYLCGYNWIIFDLLNKISYLNAFVISIHSFTSIIANTAGFGSIFVLVNLMIIIFFVKFVLCIKHVIFISSLQWYLLILCGIYFQDELFSFSFLIFYLVITIFILWDCHIYCCCSYIVLDNGGRNSDSRNRYDIKNNYNNYNNYNNNKDNNIAINNILIPQHRFELSLKREKDKIK